MSNWQQLSDYSVYHEDEVWRYLSSSLDDQIIFRRSAVPSFSKTRNFVSHC